MKPLAWITGANGLIGNALHHSAGQFAASWQVRPLTRAVVDLTDSAALRALHARERPALIIHCAALSRSVDCQRDPQLARKVNVEATRLLAELAQDAQFIFFSTDLVFDGRKGSYTEEDSTYPLSAYAESKVEAETFVLQNPQHTVVRTSLNGGKSPAGNRGFNEEMVQAWKQGQTLRFFIDEFRSPIVADVTARVVWELANQNSAGLFHVAGTERMSRLEIGELVARCHPELQPRYERASLKEYQGAPRPPDTSMNCAKAQRYLSFRIPGLGEWLAHPGNTL